VSVAADLIRQSRQAKGLTQRDLAARVGLPQSTVAAIEAGRRDPSSTTLARHLRSTGHRLITVATTGGTAAEAAEEIAVALAAGNESGAFRSLIQLCDDLAAEQGPIRLALTLTAAPLIGDRRYDAFIAAAAEHYLAVEDLPAPSWTSQPERFARPIWFVAGIPGYEADAYRTAPISFVRHGVLVNASELSSV